MVLLSAMARQMDMDGSALWVPISDARVQREGGQHPASLHM